MRHARFLAVAPVLLGICVAHAAPKPCVEPAPTATVTASFGASVSLRDLVTWVAGFTCKPVVYPIALERVAGRIALVTPAAGMTSKQALAVFVQAAQASGLIVAIKPEAITLKLDPNAASAKCAALVTPASPQITTNDGEIDEAAVQKLVDSDVHLDDPTHARMSRTLLDALFDHPTALSRGARVVPSMKDGVANGIKLYAIRPSSVFAKLGFSNGDTLTTINGKELGAAVELFPKLRGAQHFDVDIIRRGKPMTIEIDVVDSM